MRIAARRACAAAVLVPVLALSAACSDDGSGTGPGGKDARGGPGTSGGNGPGRDDPGQPAEGPALTLDDLKKAALTTRDLGKGYRVTEVPAEEEKNGDVLTADKPECQPVADVLSAEPKYKRTATVNRNALKGDFAAVEAVMVFTYLAAYAPGEAGKSFAELKAALKNCTSFTVKGQKNAQTVSEAKAPAVGDESLAFSLDDPDGPMVVNVVRVGNAQASLAGSDLMGGQPSVPEEIVVKQAEKLRTAVKKG